MLKMMLNEKKYEVRDCYKSTFAIEEGITSESITVSLSAKELNQDSINELRSHVGECNAIDITNSGNEVVIGIREDYKFTEVMEQVKSYEQKNVTLRFEKQVSEAN